jgi:hypothetical protein
MDMSRRERALEEARRKRQAAGLLRLGNGHSPEPPVIASGLPAMGAGHQLPTQGSGKGLWAPTDSELLFRILPGIGLQSFYTAFPWHYFGVSADAMPCRAYINAACHVCEQVEAWSLSPNPVDHARALLMQRTHRCLLQVIDLKALDRGVQVWSVSERMLERLLAYRHEPDYADFDHPERGRNVRMVQVRGEGSRGYCEPQLWPHRSPILYPNWQHELRYLELFYEVPSDAAQVQRVKTMLGGEQQARCAVAETPHIVFQ